MDLPSPFKVPSIPGTPLYALSPERLNQQRTIAQSPSLPSYLNDGDNKSPFQMHSHHHHHHRSSDVQSKVAFLNSLSHSQTPNPLFTAPLSPTRQSAKENGGIMGSHAALQRAILGREEAEASLSNATAELSVAQARERKISERLESLMEELASVKERQAHERSVFEKEVRKARKEAFKAGSVVVKVQEELKEVRGEMSKWKREVERERSEKDQARQEAFERAYVVAGLVEEVGGLKGQLAVKETDMEGADLDRKAEEVFSEEKTKAEKEPMKSVAVQTEVVELPVSLKREVMSQGTITDAAISDLSEVSSKARSLKKDPHLTQTTDIETRPGSSSSTSRTLHADHVHSLSATADPSTLTAEEEVRQLKAQLQWERTLRKRDEDLINFMQMQCQFKACPCRVAEGNGKRFVHDREYEAAKRRKRMHEKEGRMRKAHELHMQSQLETSQPTEKEQERRVEQPKEIMTEMKGAEPSHEVPASTTAGQVGAAASQLLDDEPSEPTGTLEELTQLIVQSEPITASRPFSFSTSTSSLPPSLHAPVQIFTLPKDSFSQSQPIDFGVDDEKALFDLSPMKQTVLPLRPATALGVSCVPNQETQSQSPRQPAQSPIRLVQASPNPDPRLKSSKSMHTLSTTRPTSALASSTPGSTVSRIALKSSNPSLSKTPFSSGSPDRRGNYPVQSYSHSRTHSTNSTTSNSNSYRSTTASPNVPVTPLIRPPSSHRRAYPGTVHATTTTTTTMVPLRGFDSNDVFSPPPSAVPGTPATVAGHIRSATLPGTGLGFDLRGGGADDDGTENLTITGPAGAQARNHHMSMMLQNVPGTPISRAEALRQIRERRGRARSVNLNSSLQINPTTATAAGNGATANGNSVSGGMKSAPGSVRRGFNLTSVGNGAAAHPDAFRDVSHASAPGRI